jgi:hypothetical protein
LRNNSERGESFVRCVLPSTPINGTFSMVIVETSGFYSRSFHFSQSKGTCAILILWCAVGGFPHDVRLQVIDEAFSCGENMGCLIILTVLVQYVPGRNG